MHAGRLVETDDGEYIFSYNEAYIQNYPKQFTLQKIEGANDVLDLLSGLWDENTICLHKEFKIVLLTNKLQVLGVKTVNTGSLRQVLVDVPQIIKVTLLANTAQIVLAHNHPSGICEPNRADIELTSTVKKAADLFEINVADHIILTANSHYSFAENHHL